MNFGRKLRKLRQKYKLSQQELANEIGLGASTIGQYELNAREPNFERLEKIKEFFNVDYNTLLDNKKSIPSDINKNSIDLRTLIHQYEVTLDGEKIEEDILNSFITILNKRGEMKK